jgi:hypothetical protein
MSNNNINNTNNSDYGDGFPINDNPTKKEGTQSPDKSRPFDSGRKPEKKNKTTEYNSSGTTLNEPNKYGKK